MMVAWSRISMVLALTLLKVPVAAAAVSNEEAAALKTTLMPLGGERAGNRAGTIPAWDGGIKPTSPQTNGKIPDLFGGDKPVVTISAANMADHADKLTDGVKALLQKYPTFKVVVYPTRRTAAAPQFVYDNTFRNATRAKMGAGGSLGPYPNQAFGGIPFPIPKSGEEAIWNHLLKFSGVAFFNYQEAIKVTPDGKVVPVAESRFAFTYPYYRPDWNLEKWSAAGEDLSLRRFDTVAPAIRAGEMAVARQRIDDTKTLGYTYLTGQRRVRRIPVLCCDVPSALSGGLQNYDEAEVFSGGIGRYDWKLVGKREMYIPYNSNKFHQPKSAQEVLLPQHVNPDMMRFELHRVWVVEATLKKGERHSTPKVMLYLDEDTWGAVTGDRWDAQNKLWKVSFSVPTVFPSVPLVYFGTYVIYDVIAGGYYAATYNKGQDKAYQFFDKPLPEERFTPESLSGEGVR